MPYECHFSIFRSKLILNISMMDIEDITPKRVPRHQTDGLIRRSIHFVWLLLAPFRYHGNQWTRKAERRQDLAFWHILNKVGYVRFKFLRAIFKQKRSFRKNLTATSILPKILRVTFLPVTLSGIFVILLVCIDESISPAFLNYFEGIHSTLLATGAQIAGTFLGLYFAAISVVASTAYGKVPPELRSVLINDQVGDFYLRVVGFTGGACLFGLGIQALGYPLGIISAVLFSLLGAASVIAFIPLGRRVFRFLDPEMVTSSLMNDIKTAIKSVTASGVLARDQSIQAHHQKSAARKLDAWEEMVFVSSGRSHSSSALRVIGQNAVLLLHWYSEVKLSIARESQWFERVSKHPSYLVAKGYQLSIALQTNTWILPEMAPDQLWLEKRVSEIIQRVVTTLSKYGSNRHSMEVLELFYVWIARSANQFRVLEMEMGFQVVSQIEQAIRGPSVKVNEVTDRDRLHGLVMLDGLARAIPDAAGLLNQRLDNLQLNQLLNDASNATRSKSISLEKFPPRLRTIIESLRLKYSFERDVEGAVQTPAWYIQHHAAYFLSIDIRNTFESLLDRAEQYLPSQAKSLLDDGNIDAAVMTVQRGLEAIFKIEVCAKKTNNRMEELKHWRWAKADGQEWPSVNLEQYLERLRILRLIFIKELAHITPSLSTTPPTGNLPDSFGFAYTTLCDATIKALEDMDIATFRSVYPILIRTAFRAHERVTAELTESPVEDIVYFSADIVTDMMDISGYAYLWKFVLGEDCFWDSMKSIWDTTLSEHKNPSDLITVIMLWHDYHREHFFTSPREQIRWQWNENVRQVLEGKGFALHGISLRRCPKVIALDPIAAAYLAAWDKHKPRDLILSEYFLKRAMARDLSVPRNVKELRKEARKVSDERAAGETGDDIEFFGDLR